MAPAEPDKAFDQWVSRQLHKVYDEVLNEQVPDELLRLVEHFEPASDDDGSEGDADDVLRPPRRNGK